MVNGESKDKRQRTSNGRELDSVRRPRNRKDDECQSMPEVIFLAQREILWFVRGEDSASLLGFLGKDFGNNWLVDLSVIGRSRANFDT